MLPGAMNGRRNWPLSLDAMLQDPSHAFALHAKLIQPLAEAQQARRAEIAAKAAATKVQFFAMRNMRS